MSRASTAARAPDPGSAFAACLSLARAHYENFPVRTPLVPRAARADLAAVYAFCRTTDDLGDEFRGDRIAALAAWESKLQEVLSGSRDPLEPEPVQPVLTALATTAARCALPADPFLRLIEANRRDQTVRRYATMDALLEYCRHSATPVGRMVLGVIVAHEGIRENAHSERTDESLLALADATCIGLQLANFWQDLVRDWSVGRCYLPRDACARHGVDPEVELIRPTASPALRGLIREMTMNACGWLRCGWPLADRLTLRWRPLVRSFTRGGWKICEAIENQEYDTLRVRPTLSRLHRRMILAGEVLRAPFSDLSLDGDTERA